MNVQFDWRFVDDDAEFEKTVGKPIDVLLSSLVTHEMTVSRIRRADLWRGSWPTANQRRLHAALARTRPWQCPRGEPATFVRRENRLGALRRNLLRLRMGHLKRRRGEPWLTRRQQRLHAALGRTQPWLCPEARPE